MNLLVGVTGSVAAIKLDELISKLNKIDKINIKIILTESSLTFLRDSALVSTLFCKDDSVINEYKRIKIYTNKDEFNSWNKRGDPVLHIELRKWADLMLIAPLSANTLAKLALGLCDNLLTSVVRAWDTNKKLYIALAMNTFMYNNKLTKEHVNKIAYIYSNVYFIEPVSKALMCGDVGLGAMASVDTICEYINSFANDF